MLKYANSKKRKRISRLASFVAILVMIPAVLTFVNVLRESNFNNDAKKFIVRELEALPNASYIKKNATYIYNPQEISTIELTTFGADEIPDATVAVLQQRFSNYSALKKAKLQVNQVKNRIVNNLEYMEELRTRDSLDLMTQQQKITYLEDKVRQLSKLERSYIPFEELSNEVKVNYETIDEFSYASVINSNFSKIDTLTVFTVKWSDSLTTNASRAKDKGKLERWLKLKLKLDTLLVQYD